MVDFFQATYNCQLPEEVELVFATCPVKRANLEKTLTQRLQDEADRRAEEARLEAEKEVEKRAEEARLEAEKRAEQDAAEYYALRKIENPTDDWEWWLSPECLALEAKYQQEYYLIKQGILPVLEVAQPKEQVSEKAKRRAANKAATAQRALEREENLKTLSISLAAKKSQKMKSYIPSGW
jgi:hypothetical protein